MKLLRACVFLLGLLPAAPLASAAVTPQRTVLTSDHYESKTVDNETRALFVGSVTLTGTNLRILCDRLEIIAEGVGDKTSAAPELDRFKYLLATGHVRIVQGDREATCGRAEVLPRDDKVVLTEAPVVIDHGSDAVYAGEKITLLRGERRVIVEKVNLTGPSIKDLGFDKNQPPEPPPPAAKP
jgi:hypothetical protein